MGFDDVIFSVISTCSTKIFHAVTIIY